MRIYEFSKKYNKPNKDILNALRGAGFDVKSHMSVLPDKAVKFLEKHFGLNKKASSADIKPENNKVKNKKIKQESKSSMQKMDTQTQPSSPKLTPSEESGVGVVVAPMLLGDLADLMATPASQIIVFLLRQGVVCNRNQLLTEDQVRSVAEQFGATIIEPESSSDDIQEEELVEGNKNRLPVVVIVGHVDHGKTTLLDYIRDTRVAAKEKGGITQHLGAYRVDGDSGSVVFLDTPGHEAFTAIRKRGLKVADVAILIIAADDGVMPQTIEAINQAQSADLPIIVAINKIDKASDAQVEKIKTQLSQYGLMPEEWGGETILVKISAKEGTNIDELIEMISLQAEMLELKTNLDIPACGYILEAKKEKGRGSVATFIAQHGNLKAGDFFSCGDTSGKVVSLKNCSGSDISSVGPSVPVSIAGFDALPKAGDYLRVIPEADYRKIRSNASSGSAYVGMQSGVDMRDAKIKVYFKSDTASSDEAVAGAIRKLAKKLDENILIVGSDVGDINEGDIGYADSVGAIVYGFGVKISPSAASMAKASKVSVNLFGIIYKLVEHLEEYVNDNKEKVVIKKKIGELIVRKVFNIKGVGVIAGFYVRDGKIVKGSEGVIYRNGEEIGRGPIGSLQKERKAMKEIPAGHEGAFIIDGITDWQEEDVVECLVEE